MWYHRFSNDSSAIEALAAPNAARSCALLRAVARFYAVSRGFLRIIAFVRAMSGSNFNWDANMDSIIQQFTILAPNLQKNKMWKSAVHNININGKSLLEHGISNNQLRGKLTYYAQNDPEFQRILTGIISFCEFMFDNNYSDSMSQTFAMSLKNKIQSNKKR
jgi:hypothetical protein